jgi:saccharopine dehydrogenase-like NADP-dependent oxidoreductase
MVGSHKVIIAGAGGIGKAVGLILAEVPDMAADIYIGDINYEAAKEVTQWIQEGASSIVQIEPFHIHPDLLTDQMEYVFSSGDILLDCLPGGEAPRMATFALKYKLHYVNLTEYVAETNQILEMAKGAETGFVLQAGLAPGFINVLAHQLYKEFSEEFHSDRLDYMAMKVGALTRVVTGPHYYGFTWSPIGVATEYVKDAVVVRNHEKLKVPSLSGTTHLIIDGIPYEDDYTSGGAADLPDFFKEKVTNLDYKTIRYPGHFDWVRSQLQIVGESQGAENRLLERMKDHIPHVEDDLIVLYASVQGKDSKGVLRKKEKSMSIDPVKVGSHLLKGIQLTTAAPMLECARMLLTGKYKGPILQSSIDPEEFMRCPFIQMAFHSNKKRERVKLDA